MPRDCSTDVWNKVETVDQWHKFMWHDKENPLRLVGYYLIEHYIADQSQPMSLLEIGFGNGIDFERCFKQLHDDGKIHYTGMEITRNFIMWAQEAWPEYDWRFGSFTTANRNTFDIVYTRHTLEHASPQTYKMCLEYLMRAARKLAVITWFLRPGYEHFHCDKIAYNNAYDVETIEGIIRECGFSLETFDFGKSDSIYICRKEE